MDAKEAKYVNYIKEKYPQLDVSRVKYNLSDGKHSDVVIVNEKDVFKFAKYDWSIGFLENEIHTINLINKSLDMHLPKAESLEKGIARFSYVKGEPLYRNKLLLMDNKIQETVAEQIGVFLRQLHYSMVKDSKYRVIGTCPVSLTGEEWLQKFKELQRKVFPYCDSYSREYFSQIFRPLAENQKFLDFQPSLIHGDLMPYHILFNKEGNKISGVIDFGLSGIGDPAYDVGLLLDNLGESFVKRIGKYYRNIPYFIDRARFYACTNHLLWAGAVADMLSTRDFTNFRIYAKERDIMPIGSKWQ